MRSGFLALVLCQGLFAQTGPAIRGAVARALPALERSAANFAAKRACVSCHHNILPVLMLHLARERGLPFDTAALSAVEEKTFRALRGPDALDNAIQATTLSDPTPDDSYLLMAAHAAGLPPDLTTAVYARRLALWQRDGHWVTSDFRPPHSSSLFTATATAVRAIRLYMPRELAGERDACLRRAREWLLATPPASTEDASFRLMGLVWAGAPSEQVAAARRDLLAMQTPSGGWPELLAYMPDAYSTGEALFALRESGAAVTDRAWRAGAAFLLSTQAPDGTWRVRTRMISPAEVSPKYFSTGFPYGKDEYLSYAGSAWAAMALLTALPVRAAPAPVLPEAEPVQAWIRTALFGTPQQLTELLDAGLSPNRATGKGTTLLMMAAPDPVKVRLLLARGADAKARSASGVDALAIAATCRETVQSLTALLDAGAEIRPAGKQPLTFAAMTGDLANVQLLLARGAEPSTDALAQAVTFGYPDIVRALIRAGAPAKATESSGIDLLHWAVIANHPDVIPALVEAGVPLNATDGFGYTPLMYAATIDFGGAGAVEALLHAGADPGIRNREGRTALEQALYYRHSTLAAALR